MIKGIKIHSGYGMGLSNGADQPKPNRFPAAEHRYHRQRFSGDTKGQRNHRACNRHCHESEADLHDLQTLAENYAIPAVAGAKDACRQIFDDEPVIVDGVGGVVIVNPDADTEKDYLFLQNNHLML